MRKIFPRHRYYRFVYCRPSIFRTNAGETDITSSTASPDTSQYRTMVERAKRPGDTSVDFIKFRTALSDLEQRRMQRL